MLEMLDAFVHGAFAGYAIAIPVGAIAVLIIETALQRGFAYGFAAGTGAATADLIYATLASTLGSIVAVWLAPIAFALKIASASFLIILGGWGLWKSWGSRQISETHGSIPATMNLPQTYLALVGLTILNPATIAYFAALILGLNAETQPTASERVLFVAGAFISSWSWQSLLAMLGSIAHKYLPPKFRTVTGLIGNSIIVVLGIKILI